MIQTTDSTTMTCSSLMWYMAGAGQAATPIIHWGNGFMDGAGGFTDFRHRYITPSDGVAARDKSEWRRAHTWYIR